MPSIYQQMTLTHKQWYEIRMILRTTPPEGEQGYDRDAQDILDEIVRKIEKKLGRYADERKRLFNQRNLDLRAARLSSTDQDKINVAAQRVIDLFEVNGEKLDQEFGDKPLGILLVEDRFNWLKANWEARKKWAPSEEGVIFRRAIDYALKHPVKYEFNEESGKLVKIEEAKPAEAKPEPEDPPDVDVPAPPAAPDVAEDPPVAEPAAAG